MYNVHSKYITFSIVINYWQPPIKISGRQGCVLLR